MNTAIDDAQAQMTKAIEDFHRKHSEIKECLICHAFRSGHNWQDLQINTQPIMGGGWRIWLSKKGWDADLNVEYDFEKDIAFKVECLRRDLTGLILLQFPEFSPSRKIVGGILKNEFRCFTQSLLDHIQEEFRRREKKNDSPKAG